MFLYFVFRAIKSTIIIAPIETYFTSGNYLFKAKNRKIKTRSDMISVVFRGYRKTKGTTMKLCH